MTTNRDALLSLNENLCPILAAAACAEAFGALEFAEGIRARRADFDRLFAFAVMATRGICRDVRTAGGTAEDSIGAEQLAVSIVDLCDAIDGVAAGTGTQQYLDGRRAACWRTNSTLTERATWAQNRRVAADPRA